MGMDDGKSREKGLGVPRVAEVTVLFSLGCDPASDSRDLEGSYEEGFDISQRAKSC